MVGIIGYGAYVPKFRIKVEEIAKIWGQNPDTIKKGLSISEKSVPDSDEDTITISVHAAQNALARAGIDPKTIGAVFVGSESHPYTVKPSGTVVASVLGLGTDLTTVDTEFACRAGSTNIVLCSAMVDAGYIKHGLAIGADTSQGRPGDALEYTAAAGGAAFIIGKQNIIANILHHFSFVTDTADFFRREGEQYPSHAGRFTGAPAYFRHVISATKEIIRRSGIEPKDFSHAVFHMPNGKFPRRVAKILGFTPEQLQHSLIVDHIGNTYSGSSLLGLTRVLDNAEPDQKILMTSYGSGAGSDSFILETTQLLEEVKNKAPTTDDYIHTSDKQYIDYGTYVKMRGKLKL
jgi:hydroxymethylglutaryl-CoA synthase